MASTKNYLDPRILADLNGLVLRTRHIVDGWLAGTHHNLDPGTSTEYSQHRPYVPGDDLRHIDWKAYGRTDRIYVKQFLDETNLACTFVLDASASMQYRGPGSPLSKLEYAGCLVGSLAWLLNEQGDGTGLFVCGGSGSGTSHGARRISYPHLPPAATQFQLTQLIQQIEATKPSGDSDIGNGLREWGMRTQRRQLLVVVSDFSVTPSPWKVHLPTCDSSATRSFFFKPAIVMKPNFRSTSLRNSKAWNPLNKSPWMPTCFAKAIWKSSPPHNNACKNSANAQPLISAH